jgi:hypothetical protein
MINDQQQAKIKYTDYKSKMGGTQCCVGYKALQRPRLRWTGYEEMAEEAELRYALKGRWWLYTR